MGSIWDDFDEHYFSDDEDDFERGFKEPKTCQFCGRKNLYWEQAGGKWRLAEPDGEFHECGPDAMSPSTEGFEDLTRE